MLPEDQRRFVEDVLSLYSALHFSYEALRDTTGIGPASIEFWGFNGLREDEEEYWAYCEEIIVQQGQFSELCNDDRDNNSLCLGDTFAPPTLNEYERKHARWEEMGRPKILSKNQIIKIVEGRMPPTLGNRVRSSFNRNWRNVAAGTAGLLAGFTVFFIVVWAYLEFGLTDVGDVIPPLQLAGGPIAYIGGYVVWQVIYKGPLDVKERLGLQWIIAGLVFFGVAGQILVELFYDNRWGNFPVIILEVAAGASTYFLFKKWRDRKLKDHSR